MSIIYPIGAAILQATSFTLDKVTLSIKKVTHKTYMGISFPLIFFFTSLIFLFYHPPISEDYFTTKNVSLISIVIILTILSNLIFYKALKKDLLSEIQTLSLLGRIPLIIFAAIFFIEERNILTFSLAILASLSIVWAHWEKHHFKIAKSTIPFLIWTLTIAPFGGIISREILHVWDPVTLQIFVNGALALFFTPLYFKNIKHPPKKAIPYLILTNILTTIAWILFFFGFKTLGIIQTVLIFSLQPLLVYFFSLFFLKEKFNMKKFIAFVIILLSVGISQIF